jgi:hypothetical protein
MPDNRIRPLVLVATAVAATVLASQVRWPALTGVVVTVMIVHVGVELTALLRRTTLPWDAAALGPLSVIAWILASGLIANLLPGGLTDSTVVTMAALLPIAVSALIAGVPAASSGLGSPRDGRSRTRRALACWLIVGCCLIEVAVTVTERSEQAWLRPRGVALFVQRQPRPTVVVMNRDTTSHRYLMVMTADDSARRFSLNVPAAGRRSVSLPLTMSGVNVSLYDGSRPTGRPVRSLTLGAGYGR